MISTITMETKADCANLLSKRKKFSLNAESTCFLCCRDVFSCDTFVDESDMIKVGGGYMIRPEQVYLLPIFRHLRINFEQIVKRHCNDQDSQRFLEKVKTPDYSVTMCKQCSSKMVPLSTLCMELEVLQMKLNNCLESVHRVLVSSAMDDNPVSQDITTAVPTKEADQKISQTLRNEIKKKCQAKLGASVPKVKLTNKIIKIIKNTPIDYPSTFSPSNEAEPEVANEDEPVNKKPTAPLFAKLCSEAKKDPSRYRLCNMCDPPRLVSVTQRGRHKTGLHLETWFPSSKLPHLTMNEFKEYCVYVVKVEIISCEKLCDAKGNSNGKAKCPHCNFTAPTEGGMKLFRHHMCSGHTDLVARKVKELQRSTCLEELRAMQFSNLTKGHAEPDTLPVHFKCNICGRECKSGRGLQTHKMQKHGDSFAHNTREYKCEKCGDWFRGMQNLYEHTHVMHPKKTPVRPFLKCESCEKVFLYSSSLKRHRQIVHEKTLSRYQESKCDICGKVFQYFASLWMHKRGVHQNIPHIKNRKSAKPVSKNKQSKSKSRNKKATSSMFLQEPDGEQPIVLKVEPFSDDAQDAGSILDQRDGSCDNNEMEEQEEKIYTKEEQSNNVNDEVDCGVGVEMKIVPH